MDPLPNVEAVLSYCLCSVIAVGPVIPSMDLLRQVANCLPKRKHCIQLAESLGLGDGFLKELREGTFTDASTLNVLLVWRQRKKERATGKVLFNSLTAMNKQDVAVRFGEELLGRCESKLISELFISHGLSQFFLVVGSQLSYPFNVHTCG